MDETTARKRAATPRRLERELAVTNPALRKLIEQPDLIAKLSAQEGISRQAIYDWIWKNQVPPIRVMALAKITRVKRHQIRPDLYPSPRRA